MRSRVFLLVLASALSAGTGFSVYAAFGSILVFMFWLYIVGVVLVAGAVLNAFVEDPQRSVELAAIAARARTGQLEFPEART